MLFSHRNGFIAIRWREEDGCFDNYEFLKNVSPGGTVVTT